MNRRVAQQNGMQRDAGGRMRLLAGVSAAAMGMVALVAPAHAQEAAAPAEEPAAEEIIVTGIRASLTSAVNIKRNAEQVVDSITAQDIGALPDRSVSEALQRIPGVTLQRTNEARDPARLAAEGGGVFIRGLSWTRSELNGRDMFSANSGRAIGFEDISSDLVAGIDVYKNPSADMVEGSIAGIVNLRTRKPFDAKGQVIALSGDYNYADLRKKGYWSGNALYSNRWKLGDGEVGLLLSYSQNNIGNRTDSIQTGRYEDLDQNGTFIPASLGFRRIDWQQKRETFNGSVQLQPTDNLLFTFEGTIAKATPKEVEYATLIDGYPAVDDSYTFDDRGVLATGTVDRANLSNDTRYGKQKKKTQDYSINARWEPTDRLTVNADVQRVYSTAEVESFTVFTQFGAAFPPDLFDNSRRPTLDFDISGKSPSMSLTENGASLSDPANYWWAAAMDHIENNEAGSWAQRLDLEYTFDEDSFFKSFRFGGRATQRKLITRQTGYNWSLLSNQFWGNGGGTPVYLDEDPAGNGLPGQASLYTFNNFFRGDIAAPGVGWFPTADLVSNGRDRAYEFLQATRNTNSFGWVPLTDADYANAAARADNVSGGIIDQREKTYAGYALLRFGADESPVGRFDGNIGVRVVHTKNATTGKTFIQGPQNAMSAVDCVDDFGAAACADLVNAYAFAANTVPAENDFKSSYTSVLPSVNMRFYLQDNLYLRLAAAKAIYRPRYDQMVPFNVYAFNFRSITDNNGNALPPELVEATFSGGNPLLKPIKSNQFDMSLEYYFGNANKLTFAAFYKDIKDYIFAGGGTVPFTSNGVTFDFVDVSNNNGEKGTIKGFEVGYQQFYDFLPGPLSGLGLEANFTYVDSSGGANAAVNTLDPTQVDNAADQTLPLEGLSKYTFNIAAIYEKYGVSARLAYNWRSKYLLTTSAANLNVPAWMEDYGQLDGSILYSVTPNVKVGVQATNILNSRTYLDVGGSQFHPRYSWTDTDRRIAFLVRTQF